MASASTASMKRSLKARRTCSTVSMEIEESLWQGNCYTTPHIFVFEASLTKLANCSHKIAHGIYVPVQVYLAYNMTMMFFRRITWCIQLFFVILRGAYFDWFNFSPQWAAEPNSLHVPTRHVSLPIECYLPASIRSTYHLLSFSFRAVRIRGYKVTDGRSGAN